MMGLKVGRVNGSRGSLRAAVADDGPSLMRLWGLLFEQDETAGGQVWEGHAQEWFARYVGNRSAARFPVIVVDGEVVATAIGTLELGVPNPMCPQGRTVRLANVITHPERRGRGYGTLLVSDVVWWAKSIGADRVDLSASEDGRNLYLRAGFVLTSAPRMKLVLSSGLGT